MSHRGLLHRVALRFHPFHMFDQFLPIAIVAVAALLGFVLNYNRIRKEEEVERD